MAPKDIQALISGACECHVIWGKRLTDVSRYLEVGEILLYYLVDPQLQSQGPL